MDDLLRAIEARALSEQERKLAIFLAGYVQGDPYTPFKIPLAKVEALTGLPASTLRETRNRLVYRKVIERVGSLFRFNREKRNSIGENGTISGSTENNPDKRTEFRLNGKQSGFSRSHDHDHEVLDHEDQGHLDLIGGEAPKMNPDEIRDTRLDDLFGPLKVEQALLPGLEAPRTKAKRKAPAKATQPARIIEPATGTESQILEALQGIPGWPYDEATDLDLVRRLSAKFPTVDALGAIESYAVYKLDKPLREGEKPRSQLWTWFGNAIRFGKNIKEPERVIDLTPEGLARKEKPVVMGVQGEYRDANTGKTYMTETQFDDYCQVLVRKNLLNPRQIPKMKEKSYDGHRNLYRL